MIKQFSAGDKVTRPFKTFKNWNVQSVDSSSVDQFGRSTYVGNIGEVNPGQKIDGIFYPTGSPKYNAISEPVTNGKYERNIYSLTDAMFYKNAGNPMELFGIESTEFDPVTGRTEVRSIGDKITTLRLSKNYWGEKIVPKSVKIVDNSNSHNTYNVYDDGMTNLYITGSHFSDEHHITAVSHFPPLTYWNSASAEFFAVIGGVTQSVTYDQFRLYRDLGATVSYTQDSASAWLVDYSASKDVFDPENERFGTSVSAWFKYVAVGSPMDSMSLSPIQEGYAAIYKYDEVQGKHRLVRRFYSPEDRFNAEENPYNTSSFDGAFGYSVSVDENHLAVGAPYPANCDGSGSQAGFVYTYYKNKGGEDNWGITNTIQGRSANDLFGTCVRVDSNILAIGAPGVSSSKGEVYIFRRKRYMDSQNPCDSVPTQSYWPIIDDCGVPMTDITGSVLYWDPPVNTPAFVSGNYTWVYEATLTSSISQASDFFGTVLDVDNGRVLVGNKKTNGDGYITLFICSYISSSIGDCPTASWAQNSIYRANESTGDLDMTSPDYAVEQSLTYDGFGWSVEIDGNNFAVGSWYDKGYLPYGNAPLSLLKMLGAVYFYHYSTGSCDFVDYNLIQKTFGDQTKNTCNNFGRNISIDGLRAAVSSENSKTYYQVDYSSSLFTLESSSLQTYGDDTGVLGRISMYQLRTDYTWDRVGEVRHNKDQNNPFNVFGRGLALSHDFLVVGAPIYNYVGPSSSYSASIDYNNQISGSFLPTYSGSVFVYDLESYQIDPLIGNVFYKNGYFVITNTTSSYSTILTGTGSAGFDLTYKGTHTIFEHEYLVSVRPGEFNYSTNPSSLIQNPLLFDVNQDGIFDFTDLDLIMRYLNRKRFYDDFVFDDNGIVFEQDAAKNGSNWWANDILLTESEDVLLQESDVAAYLASSSFTAFTKTTFDYIETNLINTGILDIDGNGKIDLNDGAILVAWFTNQLTPIALRQWVDTTSVRKTVTEVKSYIGRYTGLQRFYTDPSFFGYQESSSYDLTGSYLAPVITTIGLYNSTGELVAVSKLGRPIKNLIDWPINFIVRFDT